jgi:hypothetical protein
MDDRDGRACPVAVAARDRDACRRRRCARDGEDHEGYREQERKRTYQAAPSPCAAAIPHSRDT